MTELQLNDIIEKFSCGKLDIHQTLNLLSSNKKDFSNITFNQHESEAKKELNNLIGLTEVKNLIDEYINYLQIQQIRSTYNLKNNCPVMHMIFKGNPGTGKTTVARLMGKIFSDYGFLKKGQFVETERAELVGEYIGHTAKKTKEYIEKALGGVLFIDEAYSLARGGTKDFGREAIDTLVKGMEKYKNELVVILAGYKEEMKCFLKTNPGLKSRFAINLNFPDYTSKELLQIAELMFKKREYILNQNNKHYMYNMIKKMKNRENIKKGNARMIRNLVEKTIRKQANRIFKNKENLTRKKIMTINKKDLSRGGKEIINDHLSGYRTSKCW